MKHIRTGIEEINCEENTCGDCKWKIVEKDKACCDYYVFSSLEPVLYWNDGENDYQRLGICKTQFKRGMFLIVNVENKLRKKKKSGPAWISSDYCHHKHKTKTGAVICGKIQQLLKPLTKRD